MAKKSDIKRLKKGVSKKIFSSKKVSQKMSIELNCITFVTNIESSQLHPNVII